MFSSIQRLFTIGVLASTMFAAPAPTEAERSACEPLPHGKALIPRPDTPEAFQSFSPFANAATSASTPIGYVQTYSNLLTTFDEPSQFVRYKNLNSYDAQKCATECNNEAKCNAFAIFFERSPLLKPGKGCENPSSSTLIKCTMWSGTILPDVAVNKGQMRSKFRVVMAGSNAYVKDIAFGGNKNLSPAVPKGWVAQKYNNGAAISAPLDCHGVDTYMGMSYWRDGRFDAQRCINACEAAGKSDLQNRKCNFVNTYMQRKNGVPVSQHCAMFSQYWPALFATNKGQHRGTVTVEISETDSYGIHRSDVKYTACYNVSSNEPHVSLAPSAIPIPSVISPSPAIPSLTAIPSPTTTPSPTTIPSPATTTLPSSLLPLTPRSTFPLSTLTFKTIILNNLSSSVPTPWVWQTVVIPSPSSMKIVFPIHLPSTPTPEPTPTPVRNGDTIAVFETAPSAFSTAMIVYGTATATTATTSTVKINPFLPSEPYTLFPIIPTPFLG